MALEHQRTVTGRQMHAPSGRAGRGVGTEAPNSTELNRVQSGSAGFCDLVGDGLRTDQVLRR